MSVAALLKVLRRAWPFLMGAWATYNRLAKDNPELHRQVKDQADAFIARVGGALKRRAPEERIAEMLSAAEETATARATTGTDEQQSDAESWLRRAADVRQALAVAARAEGAERRRMLRRVRTRTDALVAEVFESLMPADLRSARGDDLDPPRNPLGRLRIRGRRSRD